MAGTVSFGHERQSDRDNSQDGSSRTNASPHPHPFIKSHARTVQELNCSPEGKGDKRYNPLGTASWICNSKQDIWEKIVSPSQGTSEISSVTESSRDDVSSVILVSRTETLVIPGFLHIRHQGEKSKRNKKEHKHELIQSLHLDLDAA